MLSEMAHSQETTSQQEILHRVSSYTRETMEKMGDIVWMIKPSTDDDGGLRERMERFVFEMCNSRNIQCSFDALELDQLKLNMYQRKGIYLVFREAVNNAAKYSGAGNIQVLVKSSNSVAHIIIRDDGKGFDPVKTRKGNGLDNMLSRAKELGGHLVIESGIGSGTMISLNIPVK
jgi:signal transduction histidine kinase